MEIETYSGKFDDEIISLILSIQNNEAQIALSNGKVACITQILRESRFLQN